MSLVTAQRDTAFVGHMLLPLTSPAQDTTRASQKYPTAFHAVKIGICFEEAQNRAKGLAGTSPFVLKETKITSFILKDMLNKLCISHRLLS